MANWITDAEAREFTGLAKHRCTDNKLKLLVSGASVMINNYLSGIDVDEDDRPLIQIVCVELILYLNRDKSLSSQAFEDASEKLNDKAIKQILSKLDTILLKQNEDTDNVKTASVRFL